MTHKFFTISLVVTILYFLVFMTTLPLFHAWEGYDQKRISEVVILTLAFAFCITSHEVCLYRTRSINIIIFSILILALLSAFLAPVSRYAFIEVGLFFGLWALVMSTTQLTLSKTKGKLLISFSFVLLIAALVYLASFFVGYIAAMLEDYPREWWHLYRGFANIRFFNQFQIWSFPLLTLVFLSKPFGLGEWKKATITIIACWWMLLFVTESRGAILSSLLAILVVFYIYRKSSIDFIKTHLMLLMLGLSLYLVFFLLLPYIIFGHEISTDIVRSDISGRKVLWKSAFDLSLNNPALGVGPMHFAWYPNLLAHPHNSFLQWLSEFGVISTLLVLALFYIGQKTWLSTFNRTTLSTMPENDINLCLSILTSFLAGIIYSLFSGIIVMPMSQIMMAIVTGLMVGTYKQYSSLKAKTARSVSNGNLIRALFLCSSILLLTSIWPSLYERLDSSVDVENRKVNAVGPRLWLQGGIPLK